MRELKHPPKWMNAVLGWYCKDDLLEDLQGDLHEFFLRNVAEKGINRARLIYLMDVLKFIRSYTLKTPKFLGRMNYITLFSNNLKTSYRSILRNRLFSGINIFGLSVSMSIGLLLITLYVELHSFDEFHDNASRIYRVVNTVHGEEEDHFASTSVLAGKKIKEEFTGVEKVAILSGRVRMDARYQDHAIFITGMWATPEFGEIFDFETLEGDLVKTLRRPNHLVLTQETASRIFGQEQAVGKIIEDGNGVSFTIGAVIANPPKQSHLEFEVLSSFITLENSNKGDRSNWFNHWGNMWSHYVYLLLEENHSDQDIQEQLVPLAERENKIAETSISVRLQNLLDIVPGPNLSNAPGPSFDAKTLWVLAILSLIILLSACFNYTNLSVARALRRSKEIGVRKTIGASRVQVFFQFIIEATLVSLIALGIALLLFYLIRPFFLGALGYAGEIVDLTLNPKVIVYFFLFATVVGIMAGFFPSLVMSKMNVKAILKDTSSLKLFGNIGLRKALIVLQFSLSMIFIISTIIGFRQYEYAMNRDLGFKTENILNVRLQGNDVDLLSQKFQTVPSIKDFSFSLMIPSTGSMYSDIVTYQLTNDSADIAHDIVSANYLKLHEHQFVSGGNFDEVPLNADLKSMIVTENFLERFKIGTPDEAIGQKIKLRTGDASIIGVIKNFQYGTTSDKVESFFFLNGEEITDENYYYANLKIHHSSMSESLAEIEQVWQQVDDVHQFKAMFYDVDIQKTYFFFRSIIEIAGFVSLIAISIATLGLLGMVVFTTETKMKEISVRKILGATERDLLVLLGRGFLMLLVIAAFIAIPFTYVLFDQFILEEYIDKQVISSAELGAGALVILSIGLLTVFLQTISAARTNPANMLRNE